MRPWVLLGDPCVHIRVRLVFLRLKKIFYTRPPKGPELYLILDFHVIVIGGVFLRKVPQFNLNHDDLQWLVDIKLLRKETLEMVGYNNDHVFLHLSCGRDEITKTKILYNPP